MTQKKQTAVEWLISKIEVNSNPSLTQKEMIEYIQQAKELEKQQIIKAAYDNMGNNFDPNMGRAEQYYNETFKQD